jgi:hypothetical protein
MLADELVILMADPTYLGLTSEYLKATRSTAAPVFIDAWNRGENDSRGTPSRIGGMIGISR